MKITKNIRLFLETNTYQRQTQSHTSNMLDFLGSFHYFEVAF
jgi:hypothetical protein